MKSKNGFGNKKVIGLWMILITLVYGCTEFIEPSIEDEKVVLLAPARGTESNDSILTFGWEEVEHALNYRLQVVSPRFDKAIKLHLDTLVETYNFTDTLSPGNYEWRVRAENGSSKTAYTRGTFVIHAMPSDEEEEVELNLAAGTDEK